MRRGSFRTRGWKEYQKRLKKIERRKSFRKRLPLLWMLSGGLFLVLVSIFFAGSWIFANLRMDPQPLIGIRTEESPSPKITRADLPSLLKDLDLSVSPETGDYIYRDDEKGLIAETSIDTALQNYIKKLTERSMTHAAAVIALRPDNGQILAMVNSSGDGVTPEKELCLNSRQPAASLFKIISAAAAIEARDFSPDKILYYRGGKYTLYRNQLRHEYGRYINKTNLKEAFSGSINPVFGKIGIYDLGKDLISQYAEKFYFNRSIPFDLPMSESSIQVPEDDFGLAEIASGFNKRTLVSPLHAAMITSAVANNGEMMEPWIVRNIRDSSDRILYRASPNSLASPIKMETSLQLRILMEETVKNGTCRKTFRSLVHKKAFQNVELGAKTGTINDRSDRYKYDWLTAYALPGDGKDGHGICLVVLAVHGGKLGIRAKDIAKRILDYHFST